MSGLVCHLPSEQPWMYTLKSCRTVRFKVTGENIKQPEPNSFSATNVKTTETRQHTVVIYQLVHLFAAAFFGELWQDEGCCEGQILPGRKGLIHDVILGDISHAAPHRDEPNKVVTRS